MSITMKRAAEEAAAHRELRSMSLFMSKNIVFTNGCFDILHPGHARFLFEVARKGSVYCGVNSDRSVRALKGPTRPINNEEDRIEMVTAILMPRTTITLTPDIVFLLDETDCSTAIKEIKPDVWIKGGDYTLETLNPKEVAAAKSVGCRIEILPLHPGYGSSRVIDRIIAAARAEAGCGSPVYPGG